ncbi:MAG: hypothetical protein V3W14_11895 [Candidatus Neomarinimicrobiota bacterium]
MKKTFLIGLLVLIACSADPEGPADEEEAPLTYIPSDTVVVVPYTGVPPITEESARKIEWEGGPTRDWSVQVINDTVTIERWGYCGDECNELYRLTLVKEGSSLPRFIACTYTANHYFPYVMTITDSLVAGEIEIQDWVSDGMMSGRVRGEWLLGDSLSFMFWVNLNENERIWVSIDPIQCLGNPWEQDWLLAHEYDEYPRDQWDQLRIFREFYEDQGVEIHGIEVTFPHEVVCGACFCPRGDRISCLVDEADLPAFLGWGFVGAD